MNILDIANRHSREQAEADANVALLIVHPDERLDVQAMLDARPTARSSIGSRASITTRSSTSAVRMKGRGRGWSGPGCRSGGSDACSRLAVAARDDSGFYDPAKTRSTHAGTASLAGP
jgi:hypothetical protein